MCAPRKDRLKSGKSEPVSLGYLRFVLGLSWHKIVVLTSFVSWLRDPGVGDLEVGNYWGMIRFWKLDVCCKGYALVWKKFVED